MIDTCHQTKQSVVGVKKVVMEDVSKNGVIDPGSKFDHHLAKSIGDLRFEM
ncbi:hypothetical protein [Bacillus sp. OTU2372]|uniref:hypothetical protein n=1 Tax=Bacillus sp. OTU2372 TaxID=3043858 RepID=UPI00406D3753